MNDEYLIYGETLTAIADAIRSVSSVSTTWTPDEMAAYILANLVKPTTRQAAKTYTPGTSNQTIPAGTFLTGAATIAGDSDLAVGNIKKGVNIFGKTGTLSGIWGDPSTFYGFTAVKSGSFTLTTHGSDDSYKVTHNLDVLPKVVMYFTDGINGTANWNNNRLLGGVGIATSTDPNGFANSNPTTSGFWANASFFSNYNSKAFGTATFANTYVGREYSNTHNMYYTPSDVSNYSFTGALHSCTSTTFSITTIGYFLLKATYKWLVMG